MIVDNIKNLKLYANHKNYFNKIPKFLKENDIKNVSCGRYDLKDNCYVNIVEYETAEAVNVQLEAHKKYIDIHFIIRGSETLLYKNIELCKLSKEYSEAEDYLFVTADNFIVVNLTENMFCVCFPDDAHKPGISSDKSIKTKKAIFKIIFAE